MTEDRPFRSRGHHRVADRLEPGGARRRAHRVAAALKVVIREVRSVTTPGICRLEPLGDHLLVDPALPSGIGVLALLEIPGRWGRADAFARGEIDLTSRYEVRPQLGPPEETPARRR